MKRSHALSLLSGLAAAALFAGCSDDPPPSNPGPSTAGSTTLGGAAAGTSTAAGTTSGGTFGGGGSASETGGTAGASAGGTGGGTAAGTGGTAAGSGGTSAGTAGTGGTLPVIVPSLFLIDNITLVPKADAAGGGGGDGAGGATGDAGGAGGAAAALPDVTLTFDADLGPFKINGTGFSPGVTGETNGTPDILPATTLLWEAATGNPGGAAKASIPFSVPNQQADFGGAFAVAADLTGYELTADVKMTTIGTAGSCATAFIYVYGATGYANDPVMDLSKGVTRHLVKGEWTHVRLDLDGPYGYHSTANHPTFKPTDVTVWGVQFNTFGCP
jgi:hypothetical protein